MSKRAAKIGAVIAALLAIQGLALFLYQRVEQGRGTGPDGPFQYERLDEERPASELDLERPDGSRVRLSELRGRWVLVHFWATWCPPCREELPGLLELDRARVPGGELELLAIAVDEPWEVIRHFFGGEPSASVVRDRISTGHRRYGVSTLPASFLISPDGRAVARFDGARDWRSGAAHDFLEREAKDRETRR